MIPSSMVKNPILVVDDEPDIRSMVCEELSFHGFKYTQASSGQKAIELFSHHKFAAVITDMRMPNGSGEHLLRTIKAQFRSHIPLIIMTGFSDLTLEEAYSLGACAVFSKPFRHSQLISKLFEVLTPPKVRWGLNPSSEQTCHHLKAFVSDDPISAAPLLTAGLGEGGAFFPMIQEPGPLVGEIIDWTLILKNKLNGFLVSGKGIVRWKKNRETPGETPGFGVEFLFVEGQQREALVTYLSQCPNLFSYIPVNHVKKSTFFPQMIPAESC